MRFRSACDEHAVGRRPRNQSFTKRSRCRIVVAQYARIFGRSTVAAKKESALLRNHTVTMKRKTLAAALFQRIRCAKTLDRFAAFSEFSGNHGSAFLVPLCSCTVTTNRFQQKRNLHKGFRCLHFYLNFIRKIEN